MRGLQVNVEEGRVPGALKTVLKAVILGLILFIVCALIYSALLAFTNMSDKLVPRITQFLVMFSIVIASIYASASMKRKGWLIGIVIAAVFFLLSILVGVVSGAEISFGAPMAIKVLYYMICGIIGGMIGVNLGR